jgi:hypothetical protein
MQEWYVINSQPTLNSGFESDEWNDYISDSFDESLETPLGDDVKFCKGQYDGETGNFETEFSTKAIVQDKSPDAYTRGWQRQILTRIADRLAEYKYIKYADTLGNEQIYLIETMPSSNKIYTKAVIHECNYTLKWQDETGKIYYYPTYTADATQYNTGVENAANVVQTGYIQLMSWISADDVTIEIQRGKRMFIDLSKKHPETYCITSTSKVPYCYNEMRMMRITFTECEYNDKTDRIDLMLCDYINPEELPVPTEPLEIKYSGKPEIRIGGKKTFYIDDVENVNYNIIISELWLGMVTLAQTENKCVVKCANNTALVGAKFKLVANVGQQIMEIQIEIIGGV